MPNDYTLPPVPYLLGLLAEGQIERIQAYGHACAEHARAEITPRVVEIIKERDAALARIAELEQSVQTFRAARDGYRDDAFRLSADKRALLQGGQEQASEIARLRAELAAKDARIAELENQLGITRMCVMCGKYKPAAEPRESPGCPPVDPEYGHLCGFDMTPQEAWAHWRQRAHDRRIESDRLRAEVEALRDCLAECLDDLSSEINARALGELPRRIERDLAPVRRAAALLAQPAGPWVNPLAAEVEALRAASVIEWEPGRSYTAAELLRRAIRGLRVRKGRPVWPAVMNLFGVGSGVAHYLCRWAGRDPETGREIAARKGEGSE